MKDALFAELDANASFLWLHHWDAKAIDDAKAEITRLRAELASAVAAVAAETERCARVAETWEDGFPHDNGEWGDALEYAAEKIGAAIRGEEGERPASLIYSVPYDRSKILVYSFDGLTAQLLPAAEVQRLKDKWGVTEQGHIILTPNATSEETDDG